MPVFENSFRPSTPTGQNLQTIANAMFQPRYTPEDRARRGYYDARSREAEAKARREEYELQQMRDRARYSDPANIPNVAAVFAGVPASDARQYQSFIDEGVPYARPQLDRGAETTLQNTMGALQMLPYLTGDTNYDQLMKGIQTGMGVSRQGAAMGGDMSVPDLAAFEGAVKGQPTMGVSGGYAYKPYGSVTDVFELPAQQALGRQRDAAAGKYRAEEADVGAGDPTGSGGGRKVTSADLNTMIKLIHANVTENYPGTDENTKQRIYALAQDYFSDPGSPYYGDHTNAANAAYDTAVSTFGQDEVDKGWFGFGAGKQALQFGQPDTAPGPLPNQRTQPVQPNVVDTLPDAATLAEGTVIRDTESGIPIYKVVNGQYQPVAQ